MEIWIFFSFYFFWKYFFIFLFLEGDPDIMIVGDLDQDFGDFSHPENKWHSVECF